jgi:hypothetical protein
MITYLKKDLKKLFNIGDELCTPDNYFNIESDGDYRIIGGGVWNIESYGTDGKSSNTILWAAGKSNKEFSKTSYINTGNFRYAEWSIRDRDLLGDKSRFVPCVSCLNDSIISDPIGNKTLIFTNANTAVSPNIQIPETDDTIVMKNDEPFESFIEKWKQCDRVITNSYHGIYWSLLSGRAVSPYGYSSKFKSVMSLFDMEIPRENLYHYRTQEPFKSMIKKKQNFVSAKDCSKIRDDFRNLNIEYAEKLSRLGVKCSLKTTSSV